MEVVSGDNWSYMTWKAPVKSLSPTHQQAGCPTCHPINNVKTLRQKVSYSKTCSSQAHLGSSILVLTNYGSRLPWMMIAKPLVGRLTPAFQSCN